MASACKALFMAQLCGDGQLPAGALAGSSRRVCRAPKGVDLHADSLIQPSSMSPLCRCMRSISHGATLRSQTDSCQSGGWSWAQNMPGHSRVESLHAPPVSGNRLSNIACSRCSRVRKGAYGADTVLPRVKPPGVKSLHAPEGGRREVLGCAYLTCFSDRFSALLQHAFVVFLPHRPLQREGGASKRCVCNHVACMCTRAEYGRLVSICQTYLPYCVGKMPDGKSEAHLTGHAEEKHASAKLLPRCATS